LLLSPGSLEMIVKSPRRSQSVASPLLVPVPAAGDPAGRLQQVTAYVRTHKADAAGPAPIAVAGWLFRALAALGGYRWYMRHQHRLHT
jgi:diacylglycerol O-acyltransferase